MKVKIKNKDKYLRKSNIQKYVRCLVDKHRISFEQSRKTMFQDIAEMLMPTLY